MNRLLRGGGLAAFIGSLTVLAWWWLRVANESAIAGGAAAAAVDTGLFALFALHHSVLARPWAKARIERFVPPDLVRSLYACTAGALLVLVCLAWQPIGGLVFDATGVTALTLHLMQVIGLAVGVVTARRISIGALSGAWDSNTPARLDTSGPYQFVRHPLHSSLICLLAGTPYMTVDRVFFALLAILFIVVAMPFEEAGLDRQFGDEYAVYRRLVRWRLIPYIH